MRLPLCACLVGALAACGGGAEPPTTPVVVIVLDALHAQHVTHLGYPRKTTPNLDLLAADGVTFEKAFAPAPFTLASIPSLLTGRRPDTHGVFANTRRLAESEITLAEHLGALGYRTFGAVTNLNGSSVYGDEQGFDEYVELFRPPGAPDEVRVPSADEMIPILRDWCADAGAEEAAPFFYLHVFEPHEPYAPPDQFQRLFLDPNYTGRFKDGVTAELTQELIDQYGEVVYEDIRDAEAVLALYDANLAWVDFVLGDLMDELKKAGLYEDALIIVTSDHGEAFWQHGRRGHGGFLYDEELHIPLVVKLPGADRPRGKRVTHLASLIDVVPSVCAWLDLPLPRSELDGIALDVNAAPDAVDDRALILGSYRPKFLTAIRTATRKTIVKYDKETGQLLRAEHYDLAENPRELPEGLIADDPLARAHVDEILAVIQRAMSTKAGDAVELSAAEQAALEAIGYTEGEEE